MKTLQKFFLLAAILLSTSTGNAQTQISPEYMKIIQEANVLFLNQDYEAVLTKLDSADSIQLDTPIAINMRGAVYTEQRKWDDARTMYNKALESNPEFFAPRFNLGEILFLQKDYDKAREHFVGMLDDFEGNELLLFKICMTYLMQGKLAEAVIWKDKIKFPSDTPAYYFSHAAIDFQQGKEADAKRWIASSESIFGGAKNLIFLQSFSDIGWIKREDFIRPAQPGSIETTPAAPSSKATSGGAGAK